MKDKFQVSESLSLGILLALSGGFMDAYSYVGRGHVFANAQTGNMILMGIHISERNFSSALRYFCPVIAFALGIALAEIMRNHIKKIHWRQVSVLIEAFILIFVATLSQDFNLLANSLTSFACGIQVQSFRKIYGNNIATTMCIGNLRSATHWLVEYFEEGNKKYLERSKLYYEIIFFFILGAVLGYKCVMRFKELSILVCSILLFASFFIMFKEDENQLHSL